MKLRAEDLRPDMVIIHKGKPVTVHTIKIAKFLVGSAAAGAQTQVEVNGGVAHFWPHSMVQIVPPPPSSTWVWSSTESAYVINIVSRGDVQIYLNGEDIYGRVIHVDSDRGDAVKELS